MRSHLAKAWIPFVACWLGAAMPAGAQPPPTEPPDADTQPEVPPAEEPAAEDTQPEEAPAEEPPAEEAEPEEPAAEEPAAEEAPACAPECKTDCNCRTGMNVTPYKNVITFNFGSTVAGRLELEYERALHPRVSIFGAFYVVLFDAPGNPGLLGFGGLVGPRIFLAGAAPEGIWIAVQLGGIYRNVPGDREVRVRGFQTGAMVGYTGVWRRFVLTLGGGFNFTTGQVIVRDQSVRDNEVSPWFKIGIGVAFGR